MKRFAVFFLMIAALMQAQNPKVSSGSLERLPLFKSNYVDARNIDIWFPEGYSSKDKYAVLYMHDGQMLFDAETTWNKQAWEVDEVAGSLQSTNKTNKFIVVGIWNNSQKRHPEYFPQKPFQTLTDEQKAFVTSELQKKGRVTENFQPISDDYLKFIVTELKPYIDSHYSVNTDQANTFIAGSSMGGLISLYAICEYPKVFGGTACLSTHWPGIFAVENNPIPVAFVDYLKKNLPNPTNHKIYFDHGDQTLDALYKPFQEQVDLLMKEKGFTAKSWLSKFFAGKDHSEKSWHERLDIPLTFFFSK